MIVGVANKDVALTITNTKDVDVNKNVELSNRREGFKEQTLGYSLI